MWIVWNNAVALSCIAGAVYLASIEASGWGWLLFIAVMTSVHQTTIKKGK